MIPLTTEIVTINSPCNHVYNYIINMENYINWFPGVKAIQSKNQLAHGEIGKQYSETIVEPINKEKSITVEVKKAVEDTLFVTEADYNPLFPRMTVTFKANSNNKTLLIWSMESRSTNKFFNLLFLPVVKAIIKKRAKIGVQQLKAILETPVK